MKKYYLLVILLVWMPNMVFSQFYCDCNKPQSWREFNKSSPTNSSETKTERKQKYYNATVEEIESCWTQISQMQHHDIEENQKLDKKKDRCRAKIDRKLAKIRRKYSSSTNLG